MLFRCLAITARWIDAQASISFRIVKELRGNNLTLRLQSRLTNGIIHLLFSFRRAFPARLFFLVDEYDGENHRRD
jgi:hypothetical protein